MNQLILDAQFLWLLRDQDAIIIIMLFSENWGKVSIKHFSLYLVICYFSPSLSSSRPILPFAALLLFVYLTLFLIPFTTFTNQYLILCLCLFWFFPFMSSYSHLLTPVFLLIHFLWLPFHSHAFWKPLVQVQYIDLLLFLFWFYLREYLLSCTEFFVLQKLSKSFIWFLP